LSVQQPPPRRPASSDFGWSTSLASGAWLSRLTDGDTVDEALSPYGIVAATTAGGARPVAFSAPARYAHTEAERPCSLGWGRRGGDGGGVGRVCLGPGTHIVAAAVGGGGGGAPPAAGLTTSVTFSVVWPSVTGFRVVAAPSGRRLFPLVNGTTVNVAAIGRYSVEATSAVGAAMRVRFTAPVGRSGLGQLDQQPPFVLAGDYPGTVFSVSLADGPQTVTAVVEDWRGNTGPPRSVSFSVTGAGSA